MGYSHYKRSKITVYWPCSTKLMRWQKQGFCNLKQHDHYVKNAGPAEMKSGKLVSVFTSINESRELRSGPVANAVFWHQLSRILLSQILILICTLIASGCRNERTPPVTSTDETASKPEIVQRLFTDVTDSAGLRFRHRDGESDTYEFPRSMGSGCGFLDANGDGRLDVLLIDGGEKVSPDNSGLLGFLYLQENDGRFKDFTEEAGLKGTGYGMGLAVGDIDNDGDNDVYITKYGPDQLFLNDGTGRFTDVSELAGISNPQWSTAAAFVDLNADGWLDIVVANYVDYFPGTFCADGAGREEFCGPKDFSGAANRIFMNLGATDDNMVRFSDASGVSGMSAAPGKSLGLACRDFDEDGDVDIFVANDGEPNQLWIQTPAGYVDEAFLRGVAVNRFGEAEANMGTSIADFSNDGKMDLLVTHLSGEMNTIWESKSPGQFVDQTSQYQIGPASLAQTGFGVAAADFNCDGITDIVVANGKVKRNRHTSGTRSAFWEGYAEYNQVFLGQGSSFREARDEPPGITSTKGVYRGLATGDYDQDGDLDLLVTEIGGAARIFRNDSDRSGHWLEIVPMDSSRRRVAFGAKVVVKSSEKAWVSELLPHLSYLSSSEPLVHVGLGHVSELAGIVVQWPGDAGFEEEFSAPRVDTRVILTMGSGVRRESAVKNEPQ